MTFTRHGPDLVCYQRHFSANVNDESLFQEILSCWQAWSLEHYPLKTGGTLLFLDIFGALQKFFNSFYSIIAFKNKLSF